MTKQKFNQELKLKFLISGIVFLILILGFINGSVYRFMELTRPECLATHLVQISVIALIVSIFSKNKTKKKIQKWSIMMIIPSMLAIGLEGEIVKYQYEKTDHSLNELCKALEVYRNKIGKYPKKIEDLESDYLQKNPYSGFGIFDSKIITYELLKDGEFELGYKVRYGFFCNSYNCGTRFNYSTWAGC